MEMVVDIAILILAGYIACVLSRSKLRICKHCKELYFTTSYPETLVLQSQPRQAMCEASPVKTAPITMNSEPAATSAETPKPAEAGARYDVSAQPERSTLASGEIVIDTEGDLCELLPGADERQTATGADEELILDEDIGLGVAGIPMALGLIEAGFAVTSVSHQWRNESHRHVSESRLHLADDIAALEEELETFEEEKVQIAQDRTDIPTGELDVTVGEESGADDDIVLGPRGMSMAASLKKAGFTVSTVVPKVLLSPEELGELERQEQQHERPVIG